MGFNSGFKGLTTSETTLSLKLAGEESTFPKPYALHAPTHGGRERKQDGTLPWILS